MQRAKLPRYWREGAVEVRPFTAKKKLWASEAQGLSSEAMKGNPLTTVILRVDESKPSHRATEDLTEPTSFAELPVTLPVDAGFFEASFPEAEAGVLCNSRGTRGLRVLPCL